MFTPLGLVRLHGQELGTARGALLPELPRLPVAAVRGATGEGSQL